MRRVLRPTDAILVSSFQSRRHHALALALVASALLLATGVPLALPQDQAPPPEPNGAYARLNSAQLGRLVAPIALYPDAMVAQILSASTFPSQIVDANEWVKSHSGLSPTDLGQQADQQPWDPSVKALVQYPSVLANLAANLGWTSELGDAYYNQTEAVTKAVQEMRKKAQKAGNLRSSPQLNVSDDDGQVQIAPTDPTTVYVPEYDPWLAYGEPLDPWPYWVDTPGVWWGGPGLYFGVGFPVAPFFGFGWGWNSWGFDWHHWHPFFDGRPYFARGPAFFDRGGYYGGRRDFGGPREMRPMLGPRNSYRGFDAPRGGFGGTRSGAFSGVRPGGATRGFSARGQMSFGGGRGGFGGGFGGGARGGFGGGARGGGGRR
jgi:hypothetical protein